ATIGNMSPEFGSTAAMFPVDEETINYLRLTGRPDELLKLVESYSKEQGLWHDPSAEPRFSEKIELDLGSIVPSIAGPKRPQDRIAVTDAKPSFRGALRAYVDHDEEAISGAYDEALEESFPASDVPAAHDGVHGQTPARDYL